MSDESNENNEAEQTNNEYSSDQVSKEEPKSTSEASSTNTESVGTVLKSNNDSNNITSSSTFLKDVPNTTDESPRTTTASTVTSTSTFASVSSSDFVFGQNVHDRISSSNTNGSDSAVSDGNKKTDVNTASTSNETGSVSCMPSSSMLFCDFLKTELSNGNISSTVGEKRSLSQSAIECEESRANKRKFNDLVVVVTGEEDEINKFQTSCKIFAFDSATKSWKELGNGSLRLNDLERSKNDLESRIIVRSLGIQKVILNTKIWAEMTVEKANNKSIRLTAIDTNGEIKIFLIKMNSEKLKIFMDLIETRINLRKSQKRNQEKNGNLESNKRVKDNETQSNNITTSTENKQS